MDNHTKLVSALIAEDQKRAKKEGHNSARVAIMLEALEYAEGHPGGLAEGINNGFCGSLRDRLLRIIGESPKDHAEPTTWARKEY